MVQGQHHVYAGLETACFKEATNFGQLLMIELNDKKRLFLPLVCCCVFFADNGYHAPARFKHAPGAPKGLAANRIKHHIHFGDALLKANSPVVDDLFGSQFRDEIKVAGGSGGDDMGASSPRQLYGEDAYRARPSVDEDSFSSLQTGAVKQSLPGRQGPDGNYGRLCMSQAGGFPRDPGRLRKAILGQGSVRKPVIHALNFLADFETRDLLARSGHHSGELVSRDCTRPSLTLLVV